MRRRDINPKVFISHASEDRERFLRAFATKLRQEAGVDAWVDEWEIYPGDSLVRKIFEEGLMDAEAVIIVLSEHSVDKPWVREDLTTLIPVVIDDCEVPESLRSTVWQKIENLEEYGTEFDRIVAAIYGYRGDKLELGRPREYSQTAVDTLPGLTWC
jgi:TIR domain